MTYTLKRLLDENLIPEAILLTEKGSIKNRSLYSCAIHRTPSDGFLEQHELAFSDTSKWTDFEKDLQKLIRNAQEANAAALGLSIPEGAGAIPPSAILLADHYRLPLLLLPQGDSLQQIRATVNEAIQKQVLEDLENIQQTLFHSFFESYPLENTGELIAHTMHRPTRIIDPLGNLISEGEVHGEIPPKERTLFTAIAINGIKYGEVRLHMSGPSDPLWHRTADLEKYIAFPLSLWFNRRNIEQVTQRRIRSDFVWDLAHGKFNSMLEMREQAKYLGFHLSRSYVCLAMKATLETDSVPAPVYTEKTAEVATGIEHMILQEAKQSGRAVMTARLNLDFVLFLESTSHSSLDSIYTYLSRIKSLIAAEYPDVNCFWGISEPLSEDVDFETSYRQASQALTYCMAENVKGSWFTYHHTRKASIMASLTKSEEIQQGANEVLAELLSYDKNSSTDLLHTLTVFIANNYNASKTAKALHLNRQSLLYRLERIEQLTGMSLHNHDDLFVLEVFSRVFASY